MNIFDQVRNNPKFNTKNSWIWYQGVVNNLVSANTQINSNKFLAQNKVNLTTKLIPGKMVAFVYDPKYKETLPVYDTFPLIIPFSIQGQHFTGLNFHYLPANLRFSLLTKLLALSNNKHWDESMKLNMSWKAISSMSKFPEVSPCIKQYLKPHVRSHFLQIPPQDWMTAVLLPFQQFKKDRAQSVWKRSNQLVHSRIK